MTASTLHPGAPATGSLPAAAPATAVVVTRGVTPFVATTLRSLAAQTRSPARVLLVDAGDRPGTTSGDAQRLAELERENRELRRANAILRSASAFFAAELERPSPR